MKIDKEKLLLYLVTDRSWTDKIGLIKDVEESLKNGVSFLQLREKKLSDSEFLKESIQMKELANKYDVPLVINDNVDIAIKSNADGVHIGQGDMSVSEARAMLGESKILGVSVGNVKEAIEAEKNGADYLGVGAMFPTASKDDAIAVSKKVLKNICDSVSIPVVGIGGISSEKILELKGTNVDGVAVISAILGQKDIGKATKKLLELSLNLTGKILPKVLTIAGSDCSGGAGIQADLKTMAANGCYGMSVITALTAQNTTGVYGIENCSTKFIEKQIDCIFNDIVPNAVKIGMVSSSDIIEMIAKKLVEYDPKYIVVDPVMVSTSGSNLLNNDAIEALITKLLPLATIITPNLSEAEILSDMEIKTTEDMISAAKKISDNYDGYVLIKGGHLENHANDLLYNNGRIIWFKEDRVDNLNTHGTGCTLSSAIASNLALGYSVDESVGKSKNYITGALKSGLDLGSGSGPLNHCYKWIKNN